MSEKPMKLGSPNLLHDEFWKPISVFVVKKSQRSRSPVTKTVPAWFLHSCGCRLLSVY